MAPACVQAPAPGACAAAQPSTLTSVCRLVHCRDDGVGLAAPQVGVNVRLMVFNEAGVKGKGEEVGGA